MAASFSPPRPQPNAPLPTSRLAEIAEDYLQACDTAFTSVTSYDQSLTPTWNAHIINSILQNLITETSPSPNYQPPYKFAVNSTIFQHTVLRNDDEQKVDREEQGGRGKSDGVIKQGMHSALGAYWNNERDGSWNYKYEKAEGKGFEVVISVLWVSTG
ncbi:hypothetical protein ACLMJK_007249 [Lecanora helva]